MGSSELDPVGVVDDEEDGDEEDENEKDDNARIVMPVSDLRYSHNSVGPHFRDGGTFDALLQDLLSGRVKPLKDLVLKVYHWPERGFYSRNNRRLWCLKRYEREMGEAVFVRVIVRELPVGIMRRVARSPKLWAMLRDFLPAFTTMNDGQSVWIRRHRQGERAAYG